MAQKETNQNTTSKSNEEKSKKRRFGGRQGGPPSKKRKLDYETDLTKSRNIILVSCQKYKEKSCGRALKLVFAEYIEQFNEQNKKDNSKADTKEPMDKDVIITTDMNVDEKESKNQEKGENKETTNNEEEEDEDDDLKIKSKEAKPVNEPTLSVADAIKDELSNINKDAVCEWIKGPDGLVVINILDKNVQASKLLEFVFDKTHPERPNLSPFVFKLFPLDCTTFSRTEDMITMAQEMVKLVHWDKIPKDQPYAINYKNRGNRKLSKNRTKIITEIASVVPKGYKVDLTNPNIVFLLQTFGRTAGMSIITNNAFAKHKEYNMGNFE